MRIFIVGLAGVIGFVLLLVIFGSFFTVDQGEEAVVLTNGAVTDTVGPGLHFKSPFIQSVSMVSTQGHIRDYQPMESYSRDQQPASVTLSVNYHIPPGSAAQVYGSYGSQDNLLLRVLDQKAPAVFKNVFGTYDAQTAIQTRAKLNLDATTALQEAVKGTPLVVDGVNVKDISYSPDYVAAIAAKQSATVAVQQRDQELQQKIIDAKIAVATAQGEADSQLAIAKANAEAIKLKGDADAYAVTVMGKALSDNPNIVSLTVAQKWNGSLPSTMVPNGTLPFLGLPTPSQ